MGVFEWGMREPNCGDGGDDVSKNRGKARKPGEWYTSINLNQSISISAPEKMCHGLSSN